MKIFTVLFIVWCVMSPSLSHRVKPAKAKSTSGKKNNSSVKESTDDTKRETSSFNVNPINEMIYERLVIFLYKDLKGDVKLYIPHAEKQIQIPDTQLEDNDILVKVEPQAIKKLFVDNPYALWIMKPYVYVRPQESAKDFARQIETQLSDVNGLCNDNNVKFDKDVKKTESVPSYEIKAPSANVNVTQQENGPTSSKDDDTSEQILDTAKQESNSKTIPPVLSSENVDLENDGQDKNKSPKVDDINKPNIELLKPIDKSEPSGVNKKDRPPMKTITLGELLVTKDPLHLTDSNKDKKQKSQLDDIAIEKNQPHHDTLDGHVLSPVSPGVSKQLIPNIPAESLNTQQSSDLKASKDSVGLASNALHLIPSEDSNYKEKDQLDALKPKQDSDLNKIESNILPQLPTQNKTRIEMPSVPNQSKNEQTKNEIAPVLDEMDKSNDKSTKNGNASLNLVDSDQFKQILDNNKNVIPKKDEVDPFRSLNEVPKDKNQENQETDSPKDVKPNANQINPVENQPNNRDGVEAEIHTLNPVENKGTDLPPKVLPETPKDILPIPSKPITIMDVLLKKLNLSSVNDFDTYIERETSNIKSPRTIEFDKLKSLIKEVLIKNDLKVTDEGKILDSAGQLVPVTEILVRPILVGPSGALSASENGVRVEIPKHTSFIEAIMISRKNKMLGTIPLGVALPIKDECEGENLENDQHKTDQTKLVKKRTEQDKEIYHGMDHQDDNAVKDPKQDKKSDDGSENMKTQSSQNKIASLKTKRSIYQKHHDLEDDEIVSKRHYEENSLNDDPSLSDLPKKERRMLFIKTDPRHPRLINRIPATLTRTWPDDDDYLSNDAVLINGVLVKKKVGLASDDYLYNRIIGGQTATGSGIPISNKG